MHDSYQSLVNNVSGLCEIFWGLLYSNTRNTFPPVWWTCLQIEFDSGFFAVDCTSLMSKLWRSQWNVPPMNLLPLLCMQCVRQGWWDNQLWMNLSCMWRDDLLLILINLTKLVSVQVSELNLTFLLLTLTVHGPIKLIGTSSQGAISFSVQAVGHSLCQTTFVTGKCSNLNPSIVYLDLVW